MSLIQKLAPKPTQKLGIILVGLSLTPNNDCPFQHKVALFARGNSLPPSRTLTYSLVTPTKDELLAQITEALDKNQEE